MIDESLKTEGLKAKQSRAKQMIPVRRSTSQSDDWHIKDTGQGRTFTVEGNRVTGFHRFVFWLPETVMSWFGLFLAISFWLEVLSSASFPNHWWRCSGGRVGRGGGMILWFFPTVLVTFTGRFDRWMDGDLRLIKKYLVKNDGSHG